MMDMKFIITASDVATLIFFIVLIVVGLIGVVNYLIKRRK